MKTDWLEWKLGAAAPTSSDPKGSDACRANKRYIIAGLSVLLSLVGAGCGSSGSGSTGLTTVPEGSWAGTGIGLQVSRASSAVTYGCGSGEIDQPLLLDSNGHFDVTGSTSPGSPIAVVGGPPAAKFPTHYTGSTDGQAMQLTTMETLSTGVVTNSYTLTFGKQFNGPVCIR